MLCIPKSVVCLSFEYKSAYLSQALEKIHREKYGGGGAATQFEDDIVPPLMRRSIAVYEAGRVLIGYMTPHYDEISKVCCLFDTVTTCSNKQGQLVAQPVHDAFCGCCFSW